MALLLLVIVNWNGFGQGFLDSPLSYGMYDAGKITTVLDHSMVQNSNGFWQYGSTSTGGGNGIITAFNGEVANGSARPGEPICIGGAILLKPTPTSPFSTAMVNCHGCNYGISTCTSSNYVYSSYDEHPDTIM